MRDFGPTLQIVGIALFAGALALVALWAGVAAGGVGLFAVGFQLERQANARAHPQGPVS